MINSIIKASSKLSNKQGSPFHPCLCAQAGSRHILFHLQFHHGFVHGVQGLGNFNEAKHSRNNILKCGNREYSSPINEAKHSRNNILKCGIGSTPLLSKQVLQDNLKRNTSNDPY
ncbi:hypothetical protein EUGRSUZ_A00067 [Eucalyptus grandis]|uniref:Uncharacterized protein n=2 Tax=Eucalyptus grandis TaxID=71139 RepID=A0ACC3LYL4_EUCGR|nr:hypothetical protein EUGRSUZ_A00067 [Eucalyptus grandis]